MDFVKGVGMMRRQFTKRRISGLPWKAVVMLSQAQFVDLKSWKAIKRMFIMFSLLLLVSNVSSAMAVEKSPSDAIAIKGYDAVAYFNLGEPLPGNEAFAFQWHGMTWLFSTKEHRDLFAAHPEKYAPQYDGYCAWAMTEARKAETDPKVWKIVNGKLYLNCSEAAYQKWSSDIPGNIKKADANWLKLSGRN
jgi:YHS domain-containing protein